MKLLYQICNCNNKKIEIKKSCDITKAKILSVLFSLIIIIDIIVFGLVSGADDKIKDASCEFTFEYQKTYQSCNDLKKRIDAAKGLSDLPSTSIHANKIIEELKKLLEQKNKVFELLQAEQRTCFTNYVKNELKAKVEFYRNIIRFNFVTFFIAFIWMCKPIRIVVYNENNPLPSAMGSCCCAFFISLLIKILSVVALFSISDLLKINDVEKYLLNCY